MSRKRMRRRVVVAARRRGARRRGLAGARHGARIARLRRSRARSRSTGSGPSSGQKHSRSDQGLQQEVPEGARQLQAGRQQHADGARDGGRGRPSAGHGRHRTAGLVGQFASQGKLKPITYAKPVLAKNYAPAWQELGTFNGKLYAIVFKAANKSTVWYNVPAFKTAGVTAAEDVARNSSTDGEDAQGVRNAGVFDRRRGGLDAHRPVREHLPAHVRSGEVRRPERAQDQVDGPDRDHRADDDGPGHRRHVEPRRRDVGRAPDNFNDSVTNAFADPPKAAMCSKADFVGGVILSSTKAKAKTGFNVFRFPTIESGSTVDGRRDRRRPVRHLPRQRRRSRRS